MRDKQKQKDSRHKCYINRRDRELARNREWKRTHRLAKYGLTRAQYEHMYTTQNGECAICKCSISGKSKSTVDHSHKTGQVRGLLCIQCNSILGMAHDDAWVLRRAINYLAKWERT